MKLSGFDPFYLQRFSFLCSSVLRTDCNRAVLDLFIPLAGLILGLAPTHDDDYGKAVVPLQLMQIHSEAEIYLQPMDNPTLEQVDA